jgi:hypothetical protein
VSGEPQLRSAPYFDRQTPHRPGYIRDAALDRSGNLYILDRTATTVRILDRRCALLTDLPKGNEQGRIAGPAGIDVTRSGRLLVADAGNSRVEIYGVNDPARPAHEFSIDVPRPYDVCSAEGEIFVATSHDDSLLHVFGGRGAPLRSFGRHVVLDYDVPVRQAADLRHVVNEGALYCDEEKSAIYYFHSVVGRVTRCHLDGAPVWTTQLEPDGFTRLRSGEGYCCGREPTGSGSLLEGHMPIYVNSGILHVSVSHILEQGRTRWYVYSLDLASGTIISKLEVKRLPIGVALRQRYEYAPGLPSRIMISQDSIPPVLRRQVKPVMLTGAISPWR